MNESLNGVGGDQSKMAKGNQKSERHKIQKGDESESQSKAREDLVMTGTDVELDLLIRFCNAWMVRLSRKLCYPSIFEFIPVREFHVHFQVLNAN
jgi:hypothetical protein